MIASRSTAPNGARSAHAHTTRECLGPDLLLMATCTRKAARTAKASTFSRQFSGRLTFPVSRAAIANVAHAKARHVSKATGIPTSPANCRCRTQLIGEPTLAPPMRRLRLATVEVPGRARVRGSRWEEDLLVRVSDQDRSSFAVAYQPRLSRSWHGSERTQGIRGRSMGARCATLSEHPEAGGCGSKCQKSSLHGCSKLQLGQDIETK